MIPLEDIYAARERIAGAVVRTPLVRLNAPEVPGEVWLKLESLQPIGAFKLRGALNAIKSAPSGALAEGVVTASTGNMAQGVAWSARLEGVPCTVVVPDNAPAMKLAAIERLGAQTIAVTFARWWQTLEEARFDDAPGFFVHPVQDAPVMAGNGTAGLEIVEDLPDVDVVLVPFGGGGLISGIASAVKQLRPGTRVYAVEPETAAPLNASLAAGEPREIDFRPSFVDGAGGRAVLVSMWPRLSALVDGAFTATLDETAAAIRLLVERNRVVAEGAGALPVAAALAGKAEGRKIVCVVSGGNIDPAKLAAILRGETP